MRFTRQNKIIELIVENVVDTQEKLAELLKNSGFNVTQATVSRDIKELQLVKTPIASGQYKYTLPEQAAKQAIDRYSKIFKDVVQNVDMSGNMVVVKTLIGCANAACEAIDSLEFPYIIGTLAGDNTVFIVCDSPKNAPVLVQRFKDILSL